MMDRVLALKVTPWKPVNKPWPWRLPSSLTPWLGALVGCAGPLTLVGSEVPVSPHSALQSFKCKGVTKGEVGSGEKANASTDESLQGLSRKHQRNIWVQEITKSKKQRPNQEMEVLT